MGSAVYPWSHSPPEINAYDAVAFDQPFAPSPSHQIDWTGQTAPSSSLFIDRVAKSALATVPSSSTAAEAHDPSATPSSSAMVSDAGRLATPPDTSTTLGPSAAAAIGQSPVSSTSSSVTAANMGTLATPSETAIGSGYPIIYNIVESDGTTCGRPILLQPGVDNARSNGLRTHIREYHPSLMPHGKKQITCTWSGCVCHNCRTPGQATHVAHVIDVPVHIWNSHLNLARTCDKCDAIIWGSAGSLERHHKTCRVQDYGLPRCDICFVEFSSLVLFRLHLQPGGCTRG
jgi:hypothetical protein